MKHTVQYGDVAVRRYNVDLASVDKWMIFSQFPEGIERVVGDIGKKPEELFGSPEQDLLWKEFLVFGMLDASANPIYDIFTRQKHTVGKNSEAIGSYHHNGGVTAVGDWDGTIYIRPDMAGSHDFRNFLQSVGYKEGRYHIPYQGINKRYFDVRMERVWQFLRMVEQKAEEQGIELPAERSPSLPRIIFPGCFMIPGRIEAGEIIIQ